MKDSAAKATVDIFQEEKRLGRPVTGTAKSNAERMREYRLRRKEQGARVVVQRPDQYPASQQLESNSVAEIDRLSSELAAALKQVANLREQVKARETECKNLNNYNKDLLKTQKTSQAAYKGQLTKSRNEITALQDRVKHAEFIAGEYSQCLHRFLDECRDSDTVMVSEKWVYHVRYLLDRPAE